MKANNVRIVHIKYNPSTDTATRAQIAAGFLALPNYVQLDGKPGLISVVGGKNSLPKLADKGFEESFVISFTSFKAREHYINADPAHQALKELLAGKFDDICVVDFDY